MNQKTTIAFIIVILGILVPGYFLISSSAAPTTDEVIDASVPTSDAEAQFLNLSAQLAPLSFDKSVLIDPRFTGLIDLHTAVLPEVSGRRDPFAPFGR